MSERSPSAYPSYKPAEGDVGTADAPRAPSHASLATQPDEGRDTALGEASLPSIVPPTDRRLMLLLAHSRPIATAISRR